MENNGKLNEQELRAQINDKFEEINDAQKKLYILEKEKNFLLDELSDVIRCKYSQFIGHAVRIKGKDRWGRTMELDGFLKDFTRYGNKIVAAMTKLKKDGSPSKIDITNWRSISVDEMLNIQLI